MTMIVDKVGCVYGSLTVVGFNRIDQGRTYLDCKCVCGNIVIRRGDSFKDTSSCGCVSFRKTVNLKGLTVGRLVVLEQTDMRSSNGCVKWRCVCSCGEEVVVSSDRLSAGSTKSCGCLQRDIVREQGLRNAGENNGNFGRYRELNPNWKGGREDSDIERKSPKYIRWREEVLSRDNYTCQKCGQRGGNLNSHHILSFLRYVDERFNISNGATLCVGCHRKFHSIYTSVKFTDIDFLEYVK